MLAAGTEPPVKVCEKVTLAAVAGGAEICTKNAQVRLKISPIRPARLNTPQE